MCSTHRPLLSSRSRNLCQNPPDPSSTSPFSSPLLSCSRSSCTSTCTLQRSQSRPQLQGQAGLALLEKSWGHDCACRETSSRDQGSDRSSHGCISHVMCGKEAHPYQELVAGTFPHQVLKPPCASLSFLHFNGAKYSGGFIWPSTFLSLSHPFLLK